MLTTGPLAPFFWIEVVGCAATAVIAFVPKLRTNPLIVIAAVLAIAGIFCKRVQLLVGGFQIPNLDYAGSMTQYTVTDWASGMTGAYQGMVYWPTPIEFGIVLGVIGWVPCSCCWVSSTCRSSRLIMTADADASEGARLRALLPCLTR